MGKTMNKMKHTSIQLTKAEIQSGLDRVKWAEALIRQLPEDHDGRNSWLLNYGSSEEDEILRKILDLPRGESLFFNMFQEGGAKIAKLSGCEYRLYEIPLYGGVEIEMGTYTRTSLREAIQEALSWT